MVRVLIFIYIIAICTSCTTKNHHTVKVWDTFILDLKGPEVDESDDYNPFLNYRLEVTFQKGDLEYRIPGYFAADGNSAESSATKGNVWRAKFTPPEIGLWKYKVDFVKGENIAIDNDLTKGQMLDPDGETGKFQVIEGNFESPDFRSKGRLTYEPGMNYQQFAGDKSYFIKGGADSPENLLAFEDFDDTYSYDSSAQFIKTYSPHIQDWEAGDPSWQGGKGKGLIGALNYLSSKGMNAIYFITNNITSDGKDVWMYTDHYDFTRFDCSKLDQWDIIFRHAQNKGILLHFLTQETENELLLDNGDTGKLRKLYYRELIARFSHYPALNWNMGEENGPADFAPEGQTDQQRKDMFQYFKNTDPYNNLVVLHTHAYTKYKDTILEPLLGDKHLDGISMQIDKTEIVHEEIKKWKKISSDSGKEWLVNMDEIGMYWKGVMPDDIDPDHDTIRSDVLWGSLTAGAAGVEWYFGYKFPPADLDCEDWRSRDKMWEQTNYAIKFFHENLPFWEMESTDELISDNSNYCFSKPGEVYLIYLKSESHSETLATENLDPNGEISGIWFNPKNGDKMEAAFEYDSNGNISVTKPELYRGRDMVFLVKIH